MAGGPDDRCSPAWGRDADVEQVMRDFLAWEIGRVEQVERGGGVRFGTVRPDRT